MREAPHHAVTVAGIAGMVLSAALVAGCGGKAKVTDTGYAGTWTQGNERIRSTLAIVRDGTSWRTRVGVRSADRSFAILSGWDGRGEKDQDGAKTYDLVFRTDTDEATGHLRVTCEGSPADPARKPFHYVDELRVEPGGIKLSAFTVERDGQRFEPDARPRREYEKVSDAVAEPPPEGGGR